MFVRTIGAVAVSLMLVSGPVLAQARPLPRRPMPDSVTARDRAPIGPGASAEDILGRRARLGLTQDQITRLNTLRRETVQARQGEMAAALELRSQLRAGEITRDRFLADLTKRREAARQQVSARAERVGAVLTDAQREQLGSMRRQEVMQRMGDRMRHRENGGMRGPGAMGGMRGGMRAGGRGFRGPDGPAGTPRGRMGRPGPGPDEAPGMMTPRARRP